MKLDPPDSRHGMSTLRLALTLLAAALVPLLAYAAAPAWWSQRGVLVPNATADDYAPVNQGQLKNIARAGVAEMDARLPRGAGDALHNLVDAWASPTAQTNDFAPANLGQLKNVAKPFYDRLIAVGLISTYPWSGSSSPPDDFAVANIGQVKNAFSIDLVILLFDSDGNGLPDAWEQHYFGHLGVDPNADPDGDGLTNLQEYLNGTDPNDFYNGALPQIIPLAGDGQTVKTDSNALRAFELLVRGSNGAPLPNAPINFTAVRGGLLTADAASAAGLAESMTVRADYSGRVCPPVATVLFHANSMPGTGTVEASGGGAMARFSINVTIEGPLAAPVFLKSTKNPDGSALFEWSMSSLHIPEGASIILLARGPDGRWQPITTLEGSATSYSASAAQIALFTEFAVRIASPSGAQSALSNVVGDSSQRPTYSLIDLGQGTPYAVASNGTVVLDRPYGTSRYYRSRGGSDEPLGDNFNFSSMNDNGDIVGEDYLGGAPTGYAIFAADAASAPRVWSADGYSTYTGSSSSYLGTWLGPINEKRVIAGSEYRSEKVRNLESIHGRDFISTAPFNFTTIASYSYQYDWSWERRSGAQGSTYQIRDLDNHGGAVGLERNMITYEDTPLYFGTAPRPSGDSAFDPFALNDEGLVLGRSEGVIKFWEPLFGAFRALEVPNPVGNYEQLRVTDPPPDPEAPTFILAGNNLIIRTWKDAEGQPSDFPVYTTLGGAELLPAGSPYTNLSLQNIANNGVIVATADKQGDPFTHAVMLVPVEVMVDANRDGQMSFQEASIHDLDVTSADKPYRFWLNDDQDAVAGTDMSGEIVPVQQPDKQDDRIQSIRDCEDLTRLWLNLKGMTQMFKDGSIKVVLKFRNSGSTTPAIRLFRSVETNDGGQRYLTDEGWAMAQITPPFNQALPAAAGGGTVASSTAGVYLDPQLWGGISEASPAINLLFEGVEEGKGELYIEYMKNGQKIGEGPGVWLDISNVKKMYERAKAQPEDIAPPYYQAQPFTGPAAAYQSDPNDHEFAKSSDETDQCIVFVHGWNTAYPNSVTDSETMFKRLWHQGYKGHFAAFRWDTLTQEDFITGEYNRSEHRAFNYGSALKAWVSALSSNYTVSVIAHSMGNVVVGEALRQGMPVRNYLLMEAAIPMGSYVSDAEKLPRLEDKDAEYHTPDYHIIPGSNETTLGYRGYLENVSGTLTNFFNPEDWGLISGFTAGKETNWEKNQLDYKPDGAIPGVIHAGSWSYHYDPTYPATYPLNERAWVVSGASRNVIDSWEMKAFVARSRTRAVGAVAHLGFFRENVNLKTTYGFGNSRPDHSGQFTRDIQTLNALYQKVRQTLER
jgi:hypothetical protein